MSRWAWAEVDLGAIAHNVGVLRAVVAPSEVWVAVKADGYGHGAVAVARTVMQAGARGLCVSLVQEGVVLREAGVDAPILVLSEQPPEELARSVHHGLIGTVYSLAQIEAWSEAGASEHPVHVKVDTGMRRVGVAPDHALAVVEAVAASGSVRLAGVFTHLAVADDPNDPFTRQQLAEFDAVLARLDAAGHHPPVVHAANSAAAFAHPAARRSLVRAGIAVYGISPGPGIDDLVRDLRPALSLHARVSHVKRVGAGDRISYGLRHRFTHDTTVVTLPIGYADGVPRRSSSVGGQVLIGGRRRLMVGVVTMDQVMVDVGDDPVRHGDPAVLIGTQGTETLTAAEWAEGLDTIAYELVCGISPRIQRRER